MNNEGNLQIRNVDIAGFVNIDHVIMKELGDRIVLEGVNGVGKTMILTAIQAALEGKTGLPDKPLNEWVKPGHESAIIKLDLADGTTVKFSIRVVITADDFDLQIKEVADDGKPRKISGGPMAFLKTVINAIAFRPQAWRKKSDLEQLEEVYNYFPGLKNMLAENSKKISESEQERARLLARAKVLRLDIDRAPVTPNLPGKEIEPTEILGRLKAAQEHNKELESINSDIQVAKKQSQNADKLIETLIIEKSKTQEMLKKLQEQIALKEIDIVEAKEHKVRAEEAMKRFQSAAESFVVTPVEPIEQEIAQLNTTNEAIRKNKLYVGYMRELDATEADASFEFQKQKKLNEERTAIMATAEIPIDGLSIGDGCLLYPNSDMEMVRLSALSDGEFWPVACGLVAAFRPRVRIIVIDNMHDLDKTNFEALSDAAKKHNMQIWIHKTLWDESDAGAGFLIRGGQIIKTPA